MDSVNLEKTILIVTGTKLYNQVSRAFKKPVNIILAEELDALFHILPRNIDATLLLDLSQFNDDVEHPAIETIFKKAPRDG